MLRIRAERDYQSLLIRLFAGRWSEVAYLKLGISGLQVEVEFPSDWHEERNGWVRLGFGLFKLCFAFPWSKVVPDDYQCSGPTYGFNFFGDGLHLHWGKSHGKGTDPFTIIDMPWAWRHREHKVLSDEEHHPYAYTLRSGEIQQRVATIYRESRLWTRPWFPRRMYKESIGVTFDGEVGERSRSWKGGCIACGYETLPNESNVAALQRMQRDRKF